MAIPWATNLLHFHLNKPSKKWFLILHYFVGQLFWLLFKKLGYFFPNHLVTQLTSSLFVHCTVCKKFYHRWLGREIGHWQFKFQSVLVQWKYHLSNELGFYRGAMTFSLTSLLGENYDTSHHITYTFKEHHFNFFIQMSLNIIRWQLPLYFSHTKPIKLGILKINFNYMYVCKLKIVVIVNYCARIFSKNFIYSWKVFS